MSITPPTDGYGMYEIISPDLGQSIYGPRLDRIAAAGFKIVINYALLYGSTANMIAYINYAKSKSVRVAIALNSVCSPISGNLSVQYPTMYTEAGSPGTTAFNAFGTYVVNQVKNLPGTWGYYIADEPQDANHATVKSFHDTIVALDATKPILIICDSDTGTSGISNFWSVHTVTWADCCSVGGDDFYPLGLTGRSDDMGTVSAATQSYCNAHSINSAIVLQAFNFHSYTPKLIDMLAMLNHCLSHMTPKLVLWYSYQNIWGGPGSIHDSPFPPDPFASDIWNGLKQVLNAVPSPYIKEVLLDSPSHGYRLDDPLCYTNGDDYMTATPVSISSSVLRQQTSLLADDLDPSCHFNGINSSLTLNTTGFPTGAAPFTIEGWCSYDSFPGAGNYPGIFSIGTSAAGKAAELGFDGDAQRLVLVLKGIGEIQALSAPLPDMVYHLMGTYDGAIARFYVDGVLQGTFAVTLNITYGAAYIGRISDGWNMTGYIKDIWIYPTSLAASRIAAHYTTGMRSTAGIPVTPSHANITLHAPRGTITLVGD